MLKLALIIFAVMAVVGLYMASRILRNQFAPWALSLTHAAFGATGIVLLLWTIFTQTTGIWLLWSTGLFVVAALGGFFLASFHARKALQPKAVVFIHAGVAVIAFVLLTMVVFAPSA